MCGGLLPLRRRASFYEAPSGKEGVRMVEPWDAVYRIAELLIQTGLLVCAIQTLIHLTKKK